MFTFNSTHKKLIVEKDELKRENDELKARIKVIDAFSIVGNRYCYLIINYMLTICSFTRAIFVGDIRD